MSQVAFSRGVPREYDLRKHTYAEDPAIYPGEYITCVNDPAKAAR